MIEPTLNCRGRVLVTKPVGTEIDCRQIKTHFICIVATIVRIAQPELATTVFAPTLDAAVIQQGTIKVSTRRDLDGGTTTQPYRP
jgi:hypothetical protein